MTMHEHYDLECFRTDKDNYRWIYHTLYTGGTDALFKHFLEEQDPHQQNYIIELLMDVVAELTALEQAMAVTGDGSYERILARIRA